MCERAEANEHAAIEPTTACVLALVVVQVQARQVQFTIADVPLHWIPGRPVASHTISLANVMLPPTERWFVSTFNEALPLVRNADLADEMRGFIGQETTHADVHDNVLHHFMMQRGVDPTPILDQLEFFFRRTLAPSTSANPKRRLKHLCNRLWLIAAIEHFTALFGDFGLNCGWDDHRANPVLADLYRWHGSEEVEHRNVAHDVAAYFHDSYIARIRSMILAAAMIILFVDRGTWYLVKTDPTTNIGWWKMHRQLLKDSADGLVPAFGKVFGWGILRYLRRDFSPDEVGCTAQAVSYLARSPAARAAHR